MASSRRKPLSDITNITLTPISDLQKLVAASSSSRLGYSGSTNQKSISQSSSKSNTSIGSSNVSVAKKTVQFRGLPPSIASSGVIGSKDAAHNRRQITEKSKREREADVIFIRTPVEKRNDKGKAIAVPPSSSPSKKTKENQNGNIGILKHSQSSNVIIEETGQEFLNPSSFLVPRAKDSGKPLNTVNSHEKTREKGKAIAVPFSSSPYEKTKENQNGNEGILKHTRSSNLIIKETGQDFRNSSSFLVQRAKDSKKHLNTVNSNEKTREKGKAIAVPLSSSPYEKIKDNQNGNEGVTMYSRSSNLKIKETAQESLNPSSFLIPSAKDSGKPLNTVKSLLPRRQSEKRKFDAGASSCPPTMRPISIENNLNEAGDFKSLKSCTDPHLKHRKKTCSRTKKTSKEAEDSNDKLPEAFVQQQRAYFKEVDDFELAEEEVSSEELE